MAVADCMLCGARMTVRSRIRRANPSQATARRSSTSMPLTIAELQASLPRPGRLEWLAARPARTQAMRAADTALLLAERGMEGDRAAQRSGGRRQLTLIQWEHLPVIAALSGLARVEPAWLRRNVAVSGINLLALRTRRFRLGAVLLEGTGHCHPCSRMETALGPGGYNAVRGHGGITARILEGGVVSLGDAVVAEV